MIRFRSVALALLAAALPALARGRSPADTVFPDFDGRMAQVRTVAIVPPDVRLLEVAASGTQVYRADWSDWVVTGVGAAVEQELRARGLQVRRLEATADAEPLLREATLLHRAVVAAVFQASILHGFPGPTGRFDYTLGDLGELAGPDVDALVFVWCAGARASGRKVVHALYGGLGFTEDALTVALVARDGQVLWFGGALSELANFTNAVRAGELVKFVFDQLPTVKR